MAGTPVSRIWLAAGLLVFLGFGSLWIELAEGRIEASSWEACNLVWLFPFEWGGPYPPLARFVSSLVIHGGGPAALSSVRYLLLGLFATSLLLLERLGARSHSRAVGILAGLMVLSSPMLVAESRMYLLEVFMLPAVAVLALLFVSRAEAFSSAP